MKLYAFWSHSSHAPHFLLGGEVVNVQDDGCVEVKGYDGYAFQPTKIVSLKAGLEMKKELDNLEARYNQEITEIKNKYNKEFKRMFGKALL
jgi:hypothetical protein